MGVFGTFTQDSSLGFEWGGGWGGGGMMPSKYEIRIMMTMMELKVLGNRWQSR